MKILKPLAIAAMSIAMLAPAKAHEFLNTAIIPDSLAAAVIRDPAVLNVRGADTDMIKAAFITEYFGQCTEINPFKGEGSKTELAAYRFSAEVFQKTSAERFREALKLSGAFRDSTRSFKYCPELREKLIETFK
jgi:hypothetical protein